MSDEGRTDEPIGNPFRFTRVFDELDTAPFPPASGLDLCLDDRFPAEVPGYFKRLRPRPGDAPTPRRPPTKGPSCARQP